MVFSDSTQLLLTMYYTVHNDLFLRKKNKKIKRRKIDTDGRKKEYRKLKREKILKKETV